MEVKDPQQVVDVCKYGDIPTPKIDLFCDVEKPMKKEGKGFSLLKKEERRHTIELIAAIRESILAKYK
jgi:hypothetical protein